MINEKGETICDECGVRIVAPMWPFCPHGRTDGSEERSSYVPDEIPGGMVLENVGPEPVTVYSYTEMNQLFASRGLSRSERHSPTPGTDHDPAGVQDSRKYVDPQTLANGRELLLRSAGAREKEAEDRAFADRAYRPLPDQILTESEAKQAHRAIQQREAERGKNR